MLTFLGRKHEFDHGEFTLDMRDASAAACLFLDLRLGSQIMFQCTSCSNTVVCCVTIPVKRKYLVYIT